MARRRRAASTTPNGAITIAGYVATQLPGDRQSAQWIYLRPHAPGVLFIANLPAAVTVECVRRAFPTAGEGADDVVVQSMPHGLSCFARVRMAGGQADVASALESPADWLALESFSEEQNSSQQPEDWIDSYWNARDLDAVQKWTTATMETFERFERTREERERAEAEAGSKPDKDGFVTVRRGASAVDVSSGVSAAAFNAAARGKHALQKKKRDKGAVRGVAPDGFYRWQRRQGKKQELDELRKRFEDDKKRVAAVRHLFVD
jgi:hypothetical protein